MASLDVRKETTVDSQKVEYGHGTIEKALAMGDRHIPTFCLLL